MLRRLIPELGILISINSFNIFIFSFGNLLKGKEIKEIFPNNDFKTAELSRNNTNNNSVGVNINKNANGSEISNKNNKEKTHFVK